MGGFIIIDDGRAVATNNLDYDRMVEKIANSLPPTLEGSAFEEWLLDQRTSRQGSRLGRCPRTDAGESTAVLGCRCRMLSAYASEEAPE